VDTLWLAFERRLAPTDNVVVGGDFDETDARQGEELLNLGDLHCAILWVNLVWSNLGEDIGVAQRAMVVAAIVAQGAFKRKTGALHRQQVILNGRGKVEAEYMRLHD
jgi:hypothetical protein